jgi:haloalkane dehalogenase
MVDPADPLPLWSVKYQFADLCFDALHLDRFHLVVHGIGGPVGFELAAAKPAGRRS